MWPAPSEGKRVSRSVSLSSGPSDPAVFAAGTVIDQARLSLRLSHMDLWIAYVGMGGSEPPASVREFLAGRMELTPFDYDMLAQVLNERFADLGAVHPVPYSEWFQHDGIGGPTPAG
ncbi:MAG: hypothetical protein JWM47_12 [Acidimicrobiales bacterium]|nr:hypothetical protein [Acidimicrobiales bacterium]